MTFTKEISKSFNRQAAGYEVAAIAQQEIGHRLLERLHYIKLKPRRILDLGCGPGFFSRELAKLYPKAQIVGLDLASSMLVQAKKKFSWRQKWSLAQADMQRLPFAPGSFDLVFANQAIHWGDSLAQVFAEINRVMNLHACFMFTTLGPDTFQELKSAWESVHQYMHVNEFPDMHDVGDCLMAEQFLEPVVDMERLTLHYQNVEQVMQSLKAQGVRNVHPARNPGLTTRASWERFKQNYSLMQTETNKYPLSYEVIYGHAWKGTQHRHEQGVETRIAITQIKKQFKN